MEQNMRMYVYKQKDVFFIFILNGECIYVIS